MSEHTEELASLTKEVNDLAQRLEAAEHLYEVSQNMVMTAEQNVRSAWVDLETKRQEYAGAVGRLSRFINNTVPAKETV